MGCSAQTDEEGYIDHYKSGEDTGIMSGHAYSLLDCFELDIHPDILKKKQERQERLKKENIEREKSNKDIEERIKKGEKKLVT